MPAASEARIAANRLNARYSTGPRTPEGRSRSRENALKHGLAGAGVVAPPDLAGEVEAELAAVRSELRPQTTLGEFLLRQATLASVRCRRAARQESASLARRVREAQADWDDARADEVDRAFERLRDEPAGNRRRLLRTPEGTTRLVEALTSLRRDLAAADPIWDAARGEMLENLLGRPTDAPLASATAALSRAILGDARGLEPASIAHLPNPEALRDWARHRLAEVIRAEAGRLAGHFEAFDFEAIEADRAEAADRALFDPGAEATLARRYEAANSRLFFRALAEFRAVEADALDRAGLPGLAPGPAPRPVPAATPTPPAAAKPAPAEFVDLAIGRGPAAEGSPRALGSFGAGMGGDEFGAPFTLDLGDGTSFDGAGPGDVGPPASELSPDRLRLVVNLLA